MMAGKSETASASALLDGHALAWSAAAALLALILTGFGWIVIDYGLDPDDFGDPLRSWRHGLLVAHGCAAYAALWLLGTLLPRHQRGGWRRPRRRRSGLLLALAALALAGSGLGLYYPPGENARQVLAIAHQAFGAALALPLLWHTVHRLASMAGRRTTRGAPGSPVGRRNRRPAPADRHRVA